MSTLPTFDELYELAKAEVIARQPLLTDWEPGSDLDALTGSGAILADQVIRICVDLFKARFVATAEGSDLDAAVVDLYPDLTRIEASGARGTLTFDRGTNTGSILIPALTQATGVGSDGVTYAYETTEDGTIQSGDDTADIPARCTTMGAAGRIAAGLVTTLTTPITDDLTSDITVTNGDRFVGGNDTETDDAYRARAQQYPAALSLGTTAAVELAALGTPGVAYATVDETDLEDSGWAYVYIADEDGRANSALADDAQANVDLVRAAGALIDVLPTTRQLVDLSLTVYVARGRATATLQAAISAAVLAFSNGLAPSAALYLSAAAAAAIAVSTDIAGAVATSTATTGASIVPSATQNAIRIDSTLITIAFVEV